MKPRLSPMGHIAFALAFAILATLLGSAFTNTYTAHAQSFQPVDLMGRPLRFEPLVPGTIQGTHPSFTLVQKPSTSGTTLEVRVSPSSELKYFQLCVSEGLSLLPELTYWNLANDYCYAHSDRQPFRYFNRYRIPESGVLMINYPATETHVVYGLGLLCELNCGYLAAHTQSIVVEAKAEGYFLRVAITKPEDYPQVGPSAIQPSMWIGTSWNVHPDERFTTVLLCVLERDPGRLTARWDCPAGEGYYPQPDGYQPLLTAQKPPYGGVPPLKSGPHWVKALGIRADGTPVESEPVLVVP